MSNTKTEPTKWTKESGLSPYRVHCTGLITDSENCGAQYLTEAQYISQLGQAHQRWRCTTCRAEAWWDDDWHESWMEAMEAESENNKGTSQAAT